MKRGLDSGRRAAPRLHQLDGSPSNSRYALSVGFPAGRRGADVAEFDLFDELSKLGARRGIGVNPSRSRAVLVIVEAMESIRSATKPDVSSISSSSHS